MTVAGRSGAPGFFRAGGGGVSTGGGDGIIRSRSAEWAMAY
tara:strand:- start:595 stop:717 length:123 start_codon:yes stop_codon:yes gene_type:complete